MKKLALLLILSLLCNLLFATIGLGQQGVSISQLKDQIAKLERLDRDASLSDEVLNLNRAFLAKKRMELANALRERIAALRKYRVEAAQAFSAAERRTIEDSIRSLEDDLTAIEGGTISAVPLSDNLAPVSDKLPPAPVSTSKVRPRTALPPPTNSVLPVSCEACNLPDEAFVIDVSTGETFWFNKDADPSCETQITAKCKNSGKTRFGKRDRIPVVVVNKNPFVYKYTVSVTETAIVEDALAPFLKAFSPIFATAGVAGITPIEIRAADIMGDPNCPAPKKENAQKAYNAIRDDLAQLNQLRVEADRLGSPTSGELLTEYRRVAVAYNDALPHFARTKPGSGFTSLCQELCKTAETLQPVLNDNKIDSLLNELQGALDALKAKADAINVEINDFLSSYPECQPRDARGLSELRRLQGDIQRVLAKEVTGSLERAAQIREKKKNEFDKMKTALDTLGERPDLLQETRYVGPFNDPTNVAVKVEYKGVSAPDNEPSKEAAKVTLNFGGDKRFNLSGGVAYGLMERPDIKPILGFERNLQGELLPNQQTPSTVIGLVDNSQRRIVPLLMLNTRITNFSDNNLFFSVGITGQADSTGTNIEYLIGPSLNVLDRRVFVTYGFYGGKIQRLNEGLYFGLKVPDATTADKLVRKDFIWKSGFGITYKIK